ncbi:metal-dependent hydrolase [Catenovulum sediminis]|uniref:Metal-dependent hydrolase n=1 Tax=Catenovulum sediminis TaxID=1740262 RepID=A0ABV1RG72_9ALTE
MHITDFKMDFTDKITLNWINNDPYMTVIFNALSIGLPVGERMFMIAIKEHLPKITNANLRQQCSIFINQEMNHATMHKAYNKAFCQYNQLSLESLEKPFRDAFEQLAKTNTAQFRLATTVAIEHLTAITSHMYLEYLREQYKMPPELKQFWSWHCQEELDHRAVAFDVYMQIYSDRAYLNQIFEQTTKDILNLYKLTAFAIIVRSRANIKLFRNWLEHETLLTHKNGIYQYFQESFANFKSESFHPTSYFGSLKLNFS